LQERVGSIIHNILDMRELSAKWVPTCLGAGQKRERMLASQGNLDGFRRDPVGFVNRLVTVDDAWFHIYDLRDQRTIQGRRHNGYPMSIELQDNCHQARCWHMSSRTEVEFLLVDYLEKGTPITVKDYVELLEKLKQQLVSKCQGKLSKGIVFLQDNAALQRVAITHQKLADLQVLKHPAFSPDLAFWPTAFFLTSRNTSGEENF
jgi:hypothetical protein